MRHDLVIGYGNTLRGDDGVGPKVAETVEALGRPRLRAIACRQLTPELADEIASARRVIFVDATIDADGPIRFDAIEAADSAQVLIHASHPTLLLGLAQQLYGFCPPAWWLTIPVVDFDFCEGISSEAMRLVQEAVALIERVLDQEPVNEPPNQVPSEAAGAV